MYKWRLKKRKNRKSTIYIYIYIYLLVEKDLIEGGGDDTKIEYDIFE